MGNKTRKGNGAAKGGEVLLDAVEGEAKEAAWRLGGEREGRPGASPTAISTSW